MKNGNQDSNKQLLSLLQRYSTIHDRELLSSDEALGSFLKENPLTKREKELVDEVINRTLDKLEGRSYINGDAYEKYETESVTDELVALHRNQSTLTPQIQQKIDELRRKMQDEIKATQNGNSNKKDE